MRRAVRQPAVVVVVVLAAVGPGCEDATVDSHMNTVAELRYVPDEGGDYWQSPAETLRRGAGDCEDFALLLRRLLVEDGIDCMVVFGVEDVEHATTGHAWVECELFDRRYILDPTRRLMRARKDLPATKYYPVLEQPDLARRLAEYLRRTGERGVNPVFEARLPPARPGRPTSRPMDAPAPGGV